MALPTTMAIKLLRIAFILAVSACAIAAQDPTRWTLTSDFPDKTLKSGELIHATLNAEIDDGWHLYALDQPAGGPIPTTIKIFDGSPFTIDGVIVSPKAITRPDANFIVDGKPLNTKFFEKTAEFGLTARAAADTPSDAFALNVRFQLCNDKFCLPPKSLKERSPVLKQ